MPKLRLIAAITILPQKPSEHSNAPMAVPCHTENGVMNDNAAASATDKIHATITLRSDLWVNQSGKML